jgi:hypothetical protein
MCRARLNTARAPAILMEGAEVKRKSTASWSVSTWIEALRFIGSSGRRRRDEFDKGVGGFIVFGVGVECRRKHGDDLKLSGKRPDDYARHRRKLWNLLHTDYPITGMDCCAARVLKFGDLKQRSATEFYAVE